MNDYGLKDSVIGQSHYAVFPEVPDYWKAVHRRGIAGEVVQADGDRFKRLDGTVQWLHWVVRPWHTDDGAIGGIVIFTEDITERRQFQEALQESRQRFFRALENIPDVVTIYDRDLRIQYIQTQPHALLLGALRRTLSDIETKRSGHRRYTTSIGLRLKRRWPMAP